ncbi:MAG: hypothetical protein JXB34_08370 [Bacteroidales bacterium]|nr:hypothetical protein [Bacteroidales bacterium]
MQKKVHILTDNFAPEIYVAGVVSSESEFQLILQLNPMLKLALKLVAPIFNASNGNNATFAHAVFDNDADIKVHLVKNKNEGQVLFKNFHTIDYIIVFSGENSAGYFEKFIKQYKTANAISLATEIELKKLKNLKKLIEPQN